MLLFIEGLGPFSDLFEEKFIPEEIGENETWTVSFQKGIFETKPEGIDLWSPGK